VGAGVDTVVVGGGVAPRGSADLSSARAGSIGRRPHLIGVEDARPRRRQTEAAPVVGASTTVLALAVYRAAGWH
jgi:hypothetical protein